MNTVTEKQAKDMSREIMGNKYAKSCLASLTIKIKRKTDLVCLLDLKDSDVGQSGENTGKQASLVGSERGSPPTRRDAHCELSTGVEHARIHTKNTDQQTNIY